MQNQKNKKTYSFSRRILALLYSFGLMLLIGFTGYSLLLVRQFGSLIDRETRKTLDLYNAQISNNLRNVEFFLMTLSENSSDVTLLGTASSLDGRYDSVASVQDFFEYNIRSFSEVSGFFTYFTRNDTVIANTKDAYDSNNFIPHLRSALRDEGNFIGLFEGKERRWVLYSFGKKYYFIRLFKEGDFYSGAWTDTEELASTLDQLNDANSLIVFTDEEGRAIDGKIGDALIPLKETLTGSAKVSLGQKDYLAISVKLDYCDYFLTALVPLASVYAPVLSTSRFLMVVLAVTLVLVFVILYWAKRFVSEPVRLFGETARRIAGGDMENRVDTSQIYVRETLDVINTFNSMLDSIEKLKIDVYEEQLQKDEIEMQYLQSQVSPHFLINCLNLIGTLSDGGAAYAKVIHELIAVLAKHLRYTLRSKNDTTLSEELSYVENYMKMTSIRFPGCLTYEITCPEETGEAAVFPLILLMFTENTIKFNMVMGEALHVVIRAEIAGNKDNPRLHLVHIDSGSGFTQDILDYYTTPPREGPMDTVAKKAHVGIYNVMRRLRLYYGETASLKLSNEEGMGARIDIDVPLIFQ